MDGPANLLITFTTDLGPLELRTWQNVSGLTNGFMGCELLQASLVNSHGAVTSDVHDSVNEGHGWASLSFDPVIATGVRIGFSRPTATDQHFKVHEFEAFAVAPAVPALFGWGPPAIILLLLASGTCVLRQRWGRAR